MDRKDARDRIKNIIKLWELQVREYPPEVQAANTTLVVMRGPDMDALRVALECLEKDLA